MRYDAFGESFHNDAQILDIADKLETFRDEALEVKGRRRMAATVRVTLDSGEERVARVDSALGSPERPLSYEGLIDKTRGLIGSITDKVDVDAIVAAVDQLPASDGVDTLTSTLGTRIYE